MLPANRLPGELEEGSGGRMRLVIYCEGLYRHLAAGRKPGTQQPAGATGFLAKSRKRVHFCGAPLPPQNSAGPFTNTLLPKGVMGMQAASLSTHIFLTREDVYDNLLCEKAEK